jgi:hypothetical protein
MNESNAMQRPLRVLRAVVALIGGGTLAVVLVMAIWIQLNPVRRDGPPLLTWIALAWGPLAVLARCGLVPQVERSGRERIARGEFVPSKASQQARLVEQRGDDGRLFLVFQTRSILAAAVLDGAALLGAAATRVDGNLMGAALGLGLCALILAGMPTAPRWTAWLERQRRLLRDEGR